MDCWQLVLYTTLSNIVWFSRIRHTSIHLQAPVSVIS